MSAEPAVHVFTGPTLTVGDVREVRPAAHVHPPVAHGDLLALPLGPGDVVVIVDGFYHQRAPVRHKEIVDLVERGVRVVGCASMGALRAAELAPVGMIGYGRVFEMYRTGEIDADDEVAVAHLAQGSFEARNIPLVNVRHAVAEAAAAGAVTAEGAGSVVATARALHYTERSWRNIGATHSGDPGTVPAVLAHLADHPEAADLKRADALAALRDLDRVLADTAAPAPNGQWRNRQVHDWLVEFAGDGDGPDRVGDGDVLRHRQVYEDGFPALWRAFVLAEAARAPEVTCGADDGPGVAEQVFALAGALERVLGGDNPYLTKQELSELGRPEVLVRTLVRSFDPPRGLHDVRAQLPPPPDVEAVRRTIREARALNDRVWWRNRQRLVERLPVARLQQHLERLWEVPPRDDELLAAARDRGFASVAEAVAAVRPYFLRDDAEDGGPAAGMWGRE